ncbi:S-layer homology domain-containing protein [Desulfovirgula thermocuniculi]|uniref:S-layer homology domain-containing protein n=1 Tax=Desulfovirgula thermocuniculi TaxID=348842 RepID=UPI000402DB0E|nr:S-layer homology domain-containing protein [Desulfovirgula thermocuniculi]
MRRLRKKAFLLLAVMLALLLPVQAALAAPLEIGKVTVNGVEVQEGQEIIANSNYVAVTGEVYSPEGKPTVKVGSVTCAVGSVRDAVYYDFSLPYLLKAGKNSITITASAGKAKDSYRFSVNYQALPLKDAKYIVPQLPTGGKIEAFNRALALKYPKNTILLDPQGKPAVNITITFTVYGDPDEAPPDFTPAGPVFCLSTSQEVYLSQQGQLSLAFDPGINAAVADQLTVWYSPDLDWDDNDNLNLGGLTDARSKTVTIPFQFRDKEGYYAVFLGQKVFKELSDSKFSKLRSPLLTLWAKGIVEPVTVGNSTNTHKKGYFGLVNDSNTEKPITRLEFTTMLVKGLGLPLSTKPVSVFKDVYDNLSAAGIYAQAYNGNENDYDANSTYYKPSVRTYIETAIQKGLVSGYINDEGELVFGPSDLLDRTEAAVILAKAANLKITANGEKAKESLKKAFKDYQYIPSCAAPYVQAAYKAKLIEGREGTDGFYFAPTENLFRAEAVAAIYRLLKSLKKI